MTTGAREHDETRRERIFIDGHQDGIAGRGLSYLILLNGFAAIVMVGAFVYGFQTSAEPKLAAAMLVFGIGAVAGLVSSFIAYLNRIVRAEMPERQKLPSALRCHPQSTFGEGSARLPVRRKWEIWSCNRSRPFSSDSGGGGQPGT